MCKKRRKQRSPTLPEVLCDLIGNILIVYVILFGQAVLSMFCVGMRVYNEQLAHARRRENSVFYSARDQSTILQPATCLSLHHPEEAI